jgi:hypothetical protein
MIPVIDAIAAAAGALRVPRSESHFIGKRLKAAL